MDMTASPVGVSVLVERCAALIEQAFLAAGQGLGGGLATVETLSGGLAGFLDEFQGGQLAEASAALDRLSLRLVAVGETLPRDASDLQGLAASNEGIAKHLEGLVEHIRMMTIIASSARIEAAGVGEAAGLANFTREMSSLTDTVRASVGRCAVEHTAMTDRVRRLVAAQSALDRDFREKLFALSRELTDIFALVTERQNRASTLTGELAAGSARLAGSAGAALMALQGGDAARQRLEHVAAALRLAEPTGDGAAALPPDAVADLCRLEAAQLDDLLATFGDEAAAIDGMLAQVSHDADALATAGRLLLGDAEGGGSFLKRFRARLDDAAALIATCGRARGDVARAMDVLRTDVDGLRTIVSDLGATTLDLIMVGINAGLRATRLGTDGRSLMVIADELKRLAGVITEAATGLVAAYEALAEASRALDRSTDAGGPDDASIVGILATFAEGDRRMSAFVETLQDRTRTFEAEIRDTRRSFRDMADAVAGLRPLADDLSARGGTAQEVTEAAAAVLGTALWRLYTMAREREIHEATIGPGPDHDGEARAPGDATGRDLDDLLFTDAA